MMALGQHDLFCPLSLLTKPTPKPAQVRNAIGEVAARFAASALGLKLLPITAEKICPDFERGRMKGEIKSVGKSRNALVYKGRLDKEKAAFHKTGYLYIFVLHECRIDLPSMDAIVDTFGACKLTILGCTLDDVLAITSSMKVQKFSIHSDPTHGSQRAGYIDGGYHFPVHRIPVIESAILHVPWNDGKVSSCFFKCTQGWITATKTSK